MSDSRIERGAWAAAIVVALAAGVRFFVEYRDVGFVGWDTYPLIEVSRVGSFGDLWAVFSESLMGKSEGGLYYRPVSKVILSLDHALFGLRAPGYQGTSAWIAGASGLALFFAARELTREGNGLPIGALVAMSFFLAQPLMATVVPAPSRRPDLLCLLFMGVALASQARATRRGMILPVLPAVFALLAMLSKEGGYLLVGLLPLVTLTGARASARARWRKAALAALPVVSVALLALGARVLVLGSVVGDRPMPEGAGLSERFAQMSGWVLGRMFAPGSAFGDLQVPWLLWLAPPTAFVSTVALASSAERHRLLRSLVPALAVSVSWVAGALVLYTVGIVFQPWYALNPLFALSLGLGAIVQGLWLLATKKDWVRWVAMAGLASLAVLFFAYARLSPLAGASGDWLEATEASRRYLETAAAAIESAAPGTPVDLVRPPALLPRRVGRLQGVALFAPYTVEAWSMLRYGPEAPPLRFAKAPR